MEVSDFSHAGCVSWKERNSSINSKFINCTCSEFALASRRINTWTDISERTRCDFLGSAGWVCAPRESLSSPWCLHFWWTLVGQKHSIFVWLAFCAFPGKSLSLSVSLSLSFSVSFAPRLLALQCISSVNFCVNLVCWLMFQENICDNPSSMGNLEACETTAESRPSASRLRSNAHFKFKLIHVLFDILLCGKTRSHDTPNTLLLACTHSWQ